MPHSFTYSASLCDPTDCSPPGSSVMEVSRGKYWSGLPCPPPGALPDPGIKSGSPALRAVSLPIEPPRKSSYYTQFLLKEKQTLASGLNSQGKVSDWLSLNQVSIWTNHLWWWGKVRASSKISKTSVILKGKQEAHRKKVHRENPRDEIATYVHMLSIL